MKKHTTIQQWSDAYLLHRCCSNYYAEKFLLNMISTVTELYSHDCLTSESSFVSLTTNMLHNFIFFLDRKRTRSESLLMTSKHRFTRVDHQIITRFALYSP